ncbi:30S ribosomal protein S27e [Sulfuracidifex metallicus DSM 6482 = JCM 9184]|jgi:small subunit ribosomal protein S27e|nr:30S ribosomal protein S27e [Sulfuracidifex metallicus]MCY0849776.1 30S ribosomal protein S27e [Sulfuracidifex metallicus]WOE51954.1 30S ribosomal protein S27e [Sulfuracidifex metallicus DSM 6482 = JCM 9184]
MMNKFRILIPEPNSKYLRVKCSQCGYEQTVFSNSTFPVRCLSCGSQLVFAKGGKAKINGDILKVLG